WDDRDERENQSQKQCKAGFHTTAVQQPNRRRFQLAPRRPYSTDIALSNRGRTSSTACAIAIIATINRDAAVPSRGNKSHSRRWAAIVRAGRGFLPASLQQVM